MNKNHYALLRDRFIPMEDRVFLQLPEGKNWTYGDMDRLSGRFARAFRDLGVNAGDRIVTQVEKSAAAVAVYLACLRTGAIFVPLNTAYTLTEVDYFLKDAAPAIYLCTPERFLQMQARDVNAVVGQIIALGTNDREYFWSHVNDLEEYDEISDSAESDVAAMLYTSGTTGQPKGAMLTHGNLTSNAITLHDYWGFGPTDVLLHALPVYHIHGLFTALHCAMLSACRVLFLSAFDAGEVRMQLPQATVMMGVPTYYSRLLAGTDFNAGECEHIRVFISGSAPLTPAVFREFEARTGQRILERYGMTETGMIASNPLQGDRIPGTVGYALPGIEVRITDDMGNLLPEGQIGNVEVRGPNVFTGYWNKPELTQQAFRDDGFFITGDMGQLDDKRLSLSGRSKDLIISGGLNVYPKEIEMCLDNFPGVSESAVIGVPHSDFGEAVAAVVVAKTGARLTEEQILNEIRSDLAGFKRPKRVLIVDELPRNAMGKVEKSVLRKRYKDLFEV